MKQWLMESMIVILKVAFLPSCAAGAVPSAFPDAEDQPQTRRAKTRKTKFLRRLQVVIMPGLGRGEDPTDSARRGADTSPGRGDGMNILVKKRARPAHGSASAAKVRRGAPGCHHRRRSCQKLFFPPRQMCGGGQRLEEAGGAGGGKAQS